MTCDRKTFNRAMPASSFLSHLKEGDAINAKAVDAAIKMIATDAAKLQDKIHGTAVACLMLSMSVAEGGPASGAGPALRLLNALPKGTRSEKLARWFAEYSNIRVRWDKKEGKFVGGVLDSKAKTYEPVTTVRIDAALATPFYDMGKDAREDVDYTTDKLAKAVAALIARATADNAKLDSKGKAALADLRNAVAKLETAK